MKTKLFHFGLLVLAAGATLIFSTCTKDDNFTNEMNSSGAVLKTGAGPSAVGLGIYHNDPTWGGISHFRFHAITLPDGNVNGDGELKHFGPDDRYLQFDVTCLVVTGNAAVMEGYITASTFELIPVGARILVRVVDNGEGGSDPDQYTGVWYEGAEGWEDWWDCTNFPQQPLKVSIEQGNFVVLP